MELLVIRHGQSEADILGRMEGRADFRLTGLGVRQAEAMAEWVNEKYPPDCILSSTLKRAAAVAEILGQKTGVSVCYEKDLMEFNNGLIAGLTFQEADEKYPRPPVKRPHESYYEQETLIEFRARAESMLSRIIHGYPPDKRIAIVSHGGMINMLFQSFLRLPLMTSTGLSTGDTGIHLWKVEGEYRHIEFLNRLEHLNSL